MKDMLMRGLLTGLVGGLGADLFWVCLDLGSITPGGAALGILAGLLGGLALGLLMMTLLGLLRFVDKAKGWELAPRLERSEPGPLGLLLGLLATFPGAGLGGIASGYGCWIFLTGIYHATPSEWSFITTFFLGVFILPLAILVGLSVGALAGATLGTTLVGLIRGTLSKPEAKSEADGVTPGEAMPLRSQAPPGTYD